MKCLTAATVNAQIELQSKLHKHQRVGTVTSYSEAVNYLLDTYATDDVVSETDAKIMRFTQLPKQVAYKISCISLE